MVAERDRDFIVGLFLIGFRTRHVDHESGILKAQIRHSNAAEFRSAKRSRESNQDQRRIAQAEQILQARGKEAADVVQQEWVFALLRDAQGAAGPFELWTPLAHLDIQRRNARE